MFSPDISLEWDYIKLPINCGVKCINPPNPFPIIYLEFRAFRKKLEIDINLLITQMVELKESKTLKPEEI